MPLASHKRAVARTLREIVDDKNVPIEERLKAAQLFIAVNEQIANPPPPKPQGKKATQPPPKANLNELLSE